MENLLLENISHDDLKKYIQEYYSYAKKELNLSIDPILILKKNQSNADDILGKTGYYDPENKLICLYITDRHAKDVLRSFAHELIHHEQNISGYNNNINLSATADPSYMLHDESLKEAERDAFERGNMMFRTWTDTKKLRRKNMLNEKKHKKPAKKVAAKGAKPDYLDFDKDGDKDESMKSALKQAKDVKKENQMKVKMKKAGEMKEVKGDDETEEISDFRPNISRNLADVPETGEEEEELELDPESLGDEKLGGGLPMKDAEQMAADKAGMDLATYKRYMASRKPKEKHYVPTEEDIAELEAKIADLQRQKEEYQKALLDDPEVQAYLDVSDEGQESLQESVKNPYPKLFERRDRLLNDAFKTKEERVYNELIRRFIKK